MQPIKLLANKVIGKVVGDIADNIMGIASYFGSKRDISKRDFQITDQTGTVSALCCGMRTQTGLKLMRMVSILLCLLEVYYTSMSKLST